MFDDSPADQPWVPNAVDANDADPDPDDTFPVPLGYTYTDVHGVRRTVGQGWFE